MGWLNPNLSGAERQRNGASTICILSVLVRDRCDGTSSSSTTRKRSPSKRDKEPDQKNAKRFRTNRATEGPGALLTPWHCSPCSLGLTLSTVPSSQNLTDWQPGSGKLPPGPPPGLTPLTPPGHGSTGVLDLPDPPSGPGSSAALVTSSVLPCAWEKLCSRSLIRFYLPQL